jgi:hypothetical protein
VLVEREDIEPGGLHLAGDGLWGITGCQSKRQRGGDEVSRLWRAVWVRPGDNSRLHRKCPAGWQSGGRASAKGNGDWEVSPYLPFHLPDGVQRSGSSVRPIRRERLRSGRREHLTGVVRGGPRLVELWSRLMRGSATMAATSLCRDCRVLPLPNCSGPSGVTAGTLSGKRPQATRCWPTHRSQGSWSWQCIRGKSSNPKLCSRR